jgi:acetyltransferase-like isoleucine patch superfamily enzyme
MKWLIENPITLWLGKLWIAKKLEWKHRNEKLKIGYLSYARNSTFGLFNTLQDNVTLNNVNLGDFSYISFNTAVSRASIGKFCSIGPDCKIGLGKHPTNTFVSTHPAFFSSSKRAQLTFSDSNYFQETENINIGNDVWLGANVIVVDGVNISDGVIVATGSVVTKDIPAYAIVGGVPAKVIKYRFEENIVLKLLDFKWWNKDIKYLKNNFKKFQDINSFFNNKEIIDD